LACANWKIGCQRPAAKGWGGNKLRVIAT
jgi:hypothetical protein